MTRCELRTRGGTMTLDTIVCSDALTYLRTLPDASVNCVVTSPPYYGLRDYGVTGQLGLEASPRAYVDAMCAVFSEVRRVLRDDGTLWLNVGDSYNNSPRGNTDVANFTKSRKDGGLGWTQEHAQRGLTDYKYDKTKSADVPQKSLLGIPWRLAFALVDDGYILRSDIIWAKPNPMPESVTDRPTKAHEYVFLMSKSGRYWYDADAVREPMKPDSASRYAYSFGGPKNIQLKATDNQTAVVGFRDVTDGRNARSVWTIATEPTPFAHFATMPQTLVERCILAGCPKGGVVLDPFVGSGTTALVARRLDRHYIGCDLNPEYVALATKRLKDTDPYQHRDMPNGAVQYSLWGTS